MTLYLFICKRFRKDLLSTGNPLEKGHQWDIGWVIHHCLGVLQRISFIIQILLDQWKLCCRPLIHCSRDNFHILFCPGINPLFIPEGNFREFASMLLSLSSSQRRTHLLPCEDPDISIELGSSQSSAHCPAWGSGMLTWGPGRQGWKGRHGSPWLELTMVLFTLGFTSGSEASPGQL